MDRIIHFFENIPGTYRALILAGGIAFFWMLEYIIPLFSFSYNKWRHAWPNIFFTITTVVVNFSFALLIVITSDWCVAHRFGLLYLVPLSPLMQLVAGLLILDLVGAWLIHYIQHRVKWMWRFHIIHHADTCVDTTTANRHHPVESVFRAVFALLAIFITGSPIWLFMIYQSLSALLAQFSHANIRMPGRLDRLVAVFIVSPNMHKVHHHFQRPQTDSNYGNIFSFWDRLFGTYDDTPVEDVKFGLDILENRNVNSIKDQLILPFDHKVLPDPKIK